MGPDPKATVIPGHGLAEATADIQSDDAHDPPPPSGGRRDLAGNTTPTDLRSPRIRESREGRPCNELGLSAHWLSTVCPHLRAPCAPRPGWAHYKAVPLQKQQDEQGAKDYIPDNSKVERMNRTTMTIRASEYGVPGAAFRLPQPPADPPPPCSPCHNTGYGTKGDRGLSARGGR